MVPPVCPHQRHSTDTAGQRCRNLGAAPREHRRVAATRTPCLGDERCRNFRSGRLARIENRDSSGAHTLTGFPTGHLYDLPRGFDGARVVPARETPAPQVEATSSARSRRCEAVDPARTHSQVPLAGHLLALLAVLVDVSSVLINQRQVNAEVAVCKNDTWSANGMAVGRASGRSNGRSNGRREVQRVVDRELSAVVEDHATRTTTGHGLDDRTDRLQDGSSDEPGDSRGVQRDAHQVPRRGTCQCVRAGPACSETDTSRSTRLASGQPRRPECETPSAAPSEGSWMAWLRSRCSSDGPPRPSNEGGHGAGLPSSRQADACRTGRGPGGGWSPDALISRLHNRT